MMKRKTALILLGLFFAVLCPGFAQTLVGKAAGDFFSAFAKYGRDGRHLNALEDLGPFMPDDVHEMLKEDLVYRVAFIAYAANQHGIITGVSSSVGFAETLNALTGFLMIIEEAGEIREWTIREILDRYEQLVATSWRNVNPTLFTVMLEAYCAYKRGELWS